MSHRIFPDDTLYLQRFLASLGLYTDTLDGDWGPNTDAAHAAFVAQSAAIAAAEGAVDARSEGLLRSLHPQLQILGRRMLKLLSAGGTDARIISGTRTYAEQDVLFKKGRFGHAGPQVTNSRGGQSNHNFCIAFDIGVFQAGKYVGNDNAPYIDAAAKVTASVPGLAWGGSWKSIKDYPHWELPTGLPIADVRARFEAGKAYV